VRSSFVGRSPPKTYGIATRARISAEDTTSFTNTALERVSFANARIRADVATFAARSRRLSTAKNTLAQIDSKAVRCQAVPHAAGFGIAQLVSTAAWPIAILGSTSPVPASSVPAIGCGTHRPLRIGFCQSTRHKYEHLSFGESGREPGLALHTAYGRSSGDCGVPLDNRHVLRYKGSRTVESRVMDRLMFLSTRKHVQQLSLSAASSAGGDCQDHHSGFGRFARRRVGGDDSVLRAR
jgi:hypothetical protein